ncbi:MAG TPA: hypothetical protein VFF16_00045 [Telluria sp.]|nr:hypothetical protein [Telluria sp.]
MRTVFYLPCAALLSSCTLLTAPHGAPDGHSVRAMLAAQVLDPGAPAGAPVAVGLDGRSAARAHAAYEKSFGEHQVAAPAPAPETTK